MKYFKIFLMWIVFITIGTYYGEYVVSREVNGFIQLLGFVGMAGLLVLVINETIKLLNKK
jgi:predicted branched-subunit amino acid permease